MNITFVVDIDITPAVDERGDLDLHAARRIIANSSDYPAGATVRLNIGAAAIVGDLGPILGEAGTVEIAGSNIKGMRILGEYLAARDPYAGV